MQVRDAKAEGIREDLSARDKEGDWQWVSWDEEAAGRQVDNRITCLFRAQPYWGLKHGPLGR
jgi:hypothetical protein